MVFAEVLLLRQRLQISEKAPKSIQCQTKIKVKSLFAQRIAELPWHVIEWAWVASSTGTCKLREDQGCCGYELEEGLEVSVGKNIQMLMEGKIMIQFRS